jgi:hypothetical protein
MGLGVHVGIPVNRSVLADINAALAEAGLPPHQEPDGGIAPASFDLGPPESLHALRRVGAHLSVGRDLPPPARANGPEDLVLARRYRGAGRFDRGPLPFAHLIDHADDGGYYVPVDFPEPLLAGDGLLGSSHQLLAECDALAAALGIPGDLDPDADALWAALDGAGGDELWERYGLESFACVRLLAAARHSVRTGAVLAFA